MSILYCQFCSKSIDTDNSPEHFHEMTNGMCEAEQERLKFPVYVKDEDYYYKIIEPTEALTVFKRDNQMYIGYQDYQTIDHEAYDLLTVNKCELITAEEFFKVFTEVSNDLIRKSK